jgi:steroid delta-isomerase
VFLSGWASTAEPTPEAAIRRALEQWPKDFNARNKAEVYSLFARDLVAAYPGQPDRNYEAMCKHLASALEDPNKRFRYDAPDIQQILVSGDLAVVRLTWTLRVTKPGVDGETVVRERGMDVFKRQKDDRWKVVISYAYPDPADEKKDK